MNEPIDHDLHAVNRAAKEVVEATHKFFNAEFENNGPEYIRRLRRDPEYRHLHKALVAYIEADRRAQIEASL